MSDNKTPFEGQEFWIRVGIVALLGGGITNLGWNVTGLNRPDPFTGEMGKELESRCVAYCGRLEKRIDQLALFCRELENEFQDHTERGEAGFLKLDTLWDYHLRQQLPDRRNYQRWQEQQGK